MKTKLSIFTEKLIEACWLAAVIAIPLFFNIYTARTFEPDKLTLMRSIVSVMILAWVIKMLEEGSSANKEQTFGQRFKIWLKQPMVLPTLAILAAYIISTALSISPMVSLWGSYQRMQGTYTFISYMVIFAMMAMTMDSRAQVDRFITTVIVASVPVALYGIIQHNGLDPLPWAGDVTSRVASNMGNAIFVSSYMIMIVPLTMVRLLKSMTAIVTEENASWGHTVLSAVYIFVIAIQILTIIYSLSRGPQIGLLGALALMGLMTLVILRQKAADKAIIAFKELGYSVGLVGALGLGAVLGGGLGYLLGMGVDALLAAARLQIGGVPLLGAALGGLIGFVGVYAYLAASGKGWRWIWLSWPIITVIGVVAALNFVIILGDPDGPLQELAQVPALKRMSGAVNTESGTGKVRTLIWEGALNLIAPHEPLGVPGDYTDNFNAIRPLIGYGPESMFNAFAFVYPPDLAHVEQRGSSADRSHNETMDSLVMTGLFGFAAFYFLMGSLFYYTLKWLGWVPHKGAKYRLIGSMVLFSIAGAVAAYIYQGDLTLSAVGLPFGLFAGLYFFICWQALLKQPDELDPKIVSSNPFLLIGLLGAFVGHFLEVHFVFSIAATYTYFWAYLGVMVAMARIQQREGSAEETAAAVAVEVRDPPPTKSRKRRGRRTGWGTRQRAAPGGARSRPENWDTWLGSLGLVMAIILIILTFDFVPVQFDISTGQYSLLWMTSITFLVGFAIALSDVAVKQGRWRTPVNWGRGILLYCVTSLGYAGFYVLLHSQQRGVLTRGGVSNALEGANGLVNLLLGFYVALFILLVLIAIMLMQNRTKGLPAWRMSNWWLYAPLAIAMVLVIYFKNFNVVKADTYLKEGERYRNARQWDNAIQIHKEAVGVDSDEDFYYLMLALDYQLQAQDGRLDNQARQRAWLDGEKVALAARDLNKYNPDNTGNMGRYYFTLGQIIDPSYYDKAIDNFEKVIELAPQNVQYYNLLAQVHYILGDFDTSLDWLNQSVELDARFFPTWLQLGDTYAAKSEVDKALEAHKQAILLNPGGFADDNYDSRLNFYISSGNVDGLIEAFEQYVEENSANEKALRKPLWAIGHAYLRSGDTEKANQYIQRAIDAGYNDARAATELGDAYLAQERFEEAEVAYLQALQQKRANAPQIQSSLGYIYARTGRLQEAINANQAVLEALPNDYDSHKNLAILYQQAGQNDLALQHARLALENTPEQNKAELEAFIAQLEGTQ